MNNRRSPFRVLATSALAVFSIALAAFTPSVGAQLNSPAPRIETIQLNHPRESTLAPQAMFTSAQVEHRVKHNNKWWMRIRVKFRVKDALNTPCRLIAYFYDEDGEPLEAGDDASYRTSTGHVSVWKDFTPSHAEAFYNDFQLYIPYSALNLDTDPGNAYDLKFYLAVSDEYNKRIFAKSTWYEFSVRW